MQQLLTSPSATVAFLAVPGLDPISQVVCLISVILAIGSVMIGMYLSRVHQPRLGSNAEIGVSSSIS